MTSGYSSGLFDCFQDCGVCLTVTCCGWTLVPSACNWAAARDEQCSICHCCAVVHPLWTRATIKRKNGFPSDAYCQDYCLYCWCFECATCQDSREVKRMQPGSMGTPLAPAGMAPMNPGQYQPPPPPGYVPTYG